MSVIWYYSVRGFTVGGTVDAYLCSNVQSIAECFYTAGMMCTCTCIYMTYVHERLGEITFRGYM